MNLVAVEEEVDMTMVKTVEVVDDEGEEDDRDDDIQLTRPDKNQFIDRSAGLITYWKYTVSSKVLPYLLYLKQPCVWQGDV